jgi:hypothetical protein
MQKHERKGVVGGATVQVVENKDANLQGGSAEGKPETEVEQDLSGWQG